MMMDSVSMTSFARPDVILFSVQVLIIFIVVCSSLVNLTFYDKNHELWTLMISSCLGYLMPNPRFKVIKDNHAASLSTGFLDAHQQERPSIEVNRNKD